MSYVDQLLYRWYIEFGHQCRCGVMDNPNNPCLKCRTEDYMQKTEVYEDYDGNEDYWDIPENERYE